MPTMAMGLLTVLDLLRWALSSGRRRLAGREVLV